MPIILGAKVDSISRADALARISAMIQDRGQHIITTPNPEIIVAVQHDPEFRAILNRAALALPDGIGLMLAARFLGMPLKERIAGSDFVWDLARLAAKNGCTVYLLGARPGITHAAAAKLTSQFPSLKIAGAESGPPRDRHPEPREGSHTDVCEKIRAAAPDILLVALGHGKQEKWIAAHLHELPSVKVAMGVGGAMDFIAGRVRRAPQVLRLLGLEWLWRLFLQPWRLPRIYRAVMKFSLLVLQAKYAKTH